MVVAGQKIISVSTERIVLPKKSCSGPRVPEMVGFDATRSMKK